MCKKLVTAFEERVLVFVVSWSCSATSKDITLLADRLRENCSAAQCEKLSHVFRSVAGRLIA